MRKKTAIDALFPKVRQGVLAAIVMNPERWWSMSELARHLKIRPSSLQRELKNLAEAGILSRREEQNRALFQPNQDCPFLRELTGLMIKTVGLVDLVRGIVAPVAKAIDCAFVYGSIARGDLTSQSDVDLMIVGKLGLSEIASKLRNAEKLLARPVNVSIFTAKDFYARNKANDNFITTVLKNEKIFVIGGSDELEAVTRK